jgi:hypothetical protein
MMGRSPRSRPVGNTPDDQRIRRRGLKLLPLRTAMVTIRFTPAERDQAEGLARTRGLSISTYGRLKMIDAPRLPNAKRAVPRETVVIPEVNQDAYRMLVGASNNLNQVARAINRGDAPELRDVHEAVRALAEAVRLVGLRVVGGD